MITRNLAQLTPNRGIRIDLPSRYGSLAALHAPAHGTDLGATALLLPGYTGSKENFAQVIDPLSDQGFEVIAVDLPGQYESPGPNAPSAYRPDPLGAVLAELIGKLAAEGRRILLTGHSYGGLVARAAVIANAPVAGLTLLGSGPAEIPPGKLRTAIDAAEVLLKEEGIEAACAAWIAQSSDWATLPKEVQDFRRNVFLRSTESCLLGMGDGLRYEPDLIAKLRAALRATSTPCLVMCGEYDNAWPIASQRDMADRLDADFGVISDAKHSPHRENPAGLLAMLAPTWRSWLAE